MSGRDDLRMLLAEMDRHPVGAVHENTFVMWRETLRHVLDAAPVRAETAEWPAVDCGYDGLHDHRVTGGFVGPFDGPHPAEPLLPNGGPE